jgi:hypothetical protein
MVGLLRRAGQSLLFLLQVVQIKSDQSLEFLAQKYHFHA